MIFIGIDDTDNPESGGTGRVAREIACALRETISVLGVSRHQLLVDERIPYTSNNSCNVMHLIAQEVEAEALADWIGDLLVERCLPGSDPGLCIASASAADHPLGRAAQTRLVTRAEAVAAANDLQAVLRPLGGTGDGVIGALAGVILAAGGNDGRFVEVGRSRALGAVVSVEEALSAGIAEVRTREGAVAASGFIDTNGGRVRPLVLGHRPVLLVEPIGRKDWRVVELGKPRRYTPEQMVCRTSGHD